MKKQTITIEALPRGVPQHLAPAPEIRRSCGNRRARGREALTRRETWGVLRVGYSPIASSTVRARIHARCASQVVSVVAPAARRLAR